MVRSVLVRLAHALAAPLLLCACPQQELALITPCTIASTQIDAPQTSVDKVDLLFVIDNSGSMSEEQIKLNQQLSKLVRVLATGDRDGMPNADGQPDFTPVSSLHLGVVSSDLGVNGQMGVASCGDRSFVPTEQDTGDTMARQIKPHGDEGKLRHSSEVAVAGVNVQINQDPVRKIEPRADCAGVNVNRFLEFERGKSDIEQVAHQFSCIAELGVNGCGYEQQLESMWRALAPNTNTSFSGMSTGQGGPAGYNAGFLRDDAILVVILVSDEEDCSSPDESRDVLYRANDSTANVLCSRNPRALHPVSRYLDGLKGLKPMYPDRIIFAGIVGVPLASASGARTPDEILALPDMQFVEETSPSGALGLRPACISTKNDGDADPARRMVELAKGFRDNGVITSICEDDYGPALARVIDRIADKLSGACLPRQLKVNAEGLVECKVLEIKAAKDQTPCGAGRTRQLEPRVIQGSERIVCEVTQLPVVGRQVPQGQGWYYDNFSAELTKTCKTAERQRIAFATSSPLSSGALAWVVCQQSVLNADRGATGVEAVNTPCSDDGSGDLHGDAKCQALSLPGQALICVQNTCQLSCSASSDCQPNFVCTPDAQARGFCANPTCPISDE